MARRATPPPAERVPAPEPAPEPEKGYALVCVHCDERLPFIEGITIREWCPSCRRPMTLLPV